ncbi:class I SAM-dependent methyltransferase (plasmid) [Mycolicibacterium psychrotolerans]|uniref:class I SAM-dependent methyltransferase n=1 Tax=Mycolicibacterium psychrotolerans TaxID=216929 RepID=UPI003D6680FC
MNVADMPRGGPGASWLDRHLQTHRLEYLDRDDVPAEVKQILIDCLQRMGERAGTHEKQARLVASLLGATVAPKVLELGAGHGELSAHLLAVHPSAQVTVTDINPTLVDAIASGRLGADPRVSTHVMDATHIDAPDDSYDLVVFSAAFHHLPPATAWSAIAEATRVGKRFVVIDGMRPAAPLLLAVLGLMLPAMGVVAAVSPKRRPIMHDALISLLRTYSKSAFVALGRAADPRMTVEFLSIPRDFRPIGVGAVVYGKPAQ